MDIYSKRGQAAATLAQDEIDRINNEQDFTLLPFSDEFPAPFDGLVEKEGKVVAAYEIRTRNAKIIDDHLIYRVGNKYPELIITKSKIDKCVEITKAMYVPFCLIIKFTNTTLIWWLTNNQGKLLIEMDTVTKKTRRSINGGTATRENYLIPFKLAKPI